MFEIPWEVPVLERPGLVVVDQRAQKVTEELLWLCKAIIAEPSSKLYEKAHSVEARATHSARPEITLQAVYGDMQPSEDGFSRTAYSQLGVLDSDGAMFVAVEHRVLSECDFSEDPFVAGIMGYFKSHFEHGNRRSMIK